MFRPASLLATILLTAAAAAATAQTASTTAPAEASPTQAASLLSEIIRSFEERGYGLTDIDIDAEIIEVEGLDADGARIEARVDSATGEVLSETPED